MDSSLKAGSRFALGAAFRAGAIAALLFLAFELIARAHLYATGAVVIGAAVLVTADLARMVRAADWLFADFVQALAAGAADVPTRGASRFPALADALARAAERLNQERQGRESRIHQLEGLLDTVAAALLIVEDDGRVQLANRAARELCGAAGPRLSGIAALGGAAEPLQALAPGARAIVRLADGRGMLAAAAGFRTGSGAPSRLVSLQSLSGELSAVELKAWNDLVRVLAHEMMNSLTPIVSLAESLQALAPIPEAADETAAAIETIARRSAGLMSFVERYRRLADVPAPRPEVFPARTFLAGLRRLMRAELAARSIAFRLTTEPEDARIHADPDLLEQAMINLLKNAIEAVDGCEAPMIELACREASGQLELSVADNGRGLPSEDPELVFTPFFTTKAGGSGIGLSLARQIALAHGGALVGRRHAPSGTLFSLTLPAGAGRSDANPEFTPSA